MSRMDLKLYRMLTTVMQYIPNTNILKVGQLDSIVRLCHQLNSRKCISQWAVDN
jgi:hypothetical protein